MTSVEESRVQEPGDQRLRCVLTIPAFNEQDALPRCLDAILAAPLPRGAVWDEWVLLDGGSTDGTVARWRTWAAAHPDLVLRVQHSGERLGKAVELEQIHSALVARREPQLLMVVCDADTKVDPTAFLHLLKPFSDDPKMAVVWGVALPHGPKKRRRASWFQSRLTATAACRLGPEAIQANGRLFATRPSSLEGFAWRPGLTADDTQLAAFVRDAGIRHKSASRAVTRIVAARGWREFYLQTYRCYAATTLLSTSANYGYGGVASASATAHQARRRLKILFGALAVESLRNPVDAISYVVARCVCFVLHRFSPVEFADAWPTSRSTKSLNEDAPPIASFGWDEKVRSALGVGREKFSLGRDVICTCDNWPLVLSAWLANRIPLIRRVGPKVLELRIRSGAILRAPNTVLSAWPMFEVLVSDVYHLDRLPWRATSGATLSVVDVGAHVGSFTVAIAQRFPNARIDSYEPSQQTVAFLRSNVEVNNLDERVRVHEAAIASTSGSLNLYSNGDASCEATTLGTAQEANGRANIVTTCEAVAFEAATNALGHVDLVKMDCEGGEYDIVLNSNPACWDGVSCVLMEYHPVEGHSWEELEEHFVAMGFTVAWQEVDKTRSGLGTAMLVRNAV